METGSTQIRWFWSILGQIYPQETQILQKNKVFPETTSLFLSNDTNPRSKINHRIIVELIKKTPFFAKNGLFKIKNRLVNKDQEVKDQFNSTYLEPRNSGLTVGVQLFVVTPLKLALFQF